MAKLSTLIWFFLSSLMVTAQEMEQSRLLAGNYQPQRIEQAIATLTATNTVGPNTQVEYKAGQSVVLNSGFEAKTGSVFVAHTGAVSLMNGAERESTSLTLSAYPNPFDKVTTIAYVLTKPGRTSIYIRDAEGRLISQLLDSHYQEAGRYSVDWQSDGIAAGTYVCILDAGPQRVSKRIIRK